MATQSNGFSTITVLLVLLAITAAGTAGWYVFQKNKKADTSNKANTTTQTSNDADQKKDDTAKPSDPSEGGKYLVIKEWGVRMPLPDSLRGDTTYGIQTRSAEQDSVVSFEVGKLAKLPNSNCKLHTEADGSGESGGVSSDLLIRKAAELPGPDGIDAATYISPDGKYKYYALQSHQGLCVTTDYEQNQFDTSDALRTALKEIQQIPTN